MPAKVASASSVPSLKRKPLSMSIRELTDDFIYSIDLDADYQREKVWTRKDQEKLLDSIIRDIDIPKLYLAQVAGNQQFKYECIDGKQRLLTISSFVSPEKNDDDSLRVPVLSDNYTFDELKRLRPADADAFLNYKLDFVVYDESKLSSEFIREIFRRLQLGTRLNSGEVLHSHTGAVRDFVFKAIGKRGPFIGKTRLSERRFSREFALAQICINSFHRSEHQEFVRARLFDLEDFFDSESSRKKNDKNFGRIKAVLKLMDSKFGVQAQLISSRAIAVSAYLFVESLYLSNKRAQIPQFVKFFVLLLKTIEIDMELVSKHQRPRNPRVLDGFQKYVLQASVESYSIERRDEFLRIAFEYYRAQGTKGRILGSRIAGR